MIKQVPCNLFVYDTTHLTSDGTYWANPIEPHWLRVLEKIHAIFKQTKVHASTADAAFVGGIVVSEDQVALVRVFDGGMDERGRMGRKVFAYLVASRRDIVNLELKYFIKMPAMKTLQALSIKGGRLPDLELIDLSPQIKSKRSIARECKLNVSPQGEFSTGTEAEAYAFCQSLLQKHENEFAVGITGSSSGWNGQITPYPIDKTQGGFAAYERDTFLEESVTTAGSPVHESKSLGGKPGRDSQASTTIRSTKPPKGPVPLVAGGVVAGLMVTCFLGGIFAASLFTSREQSDVVLELQSPPRALVAGSSFSIEYRLTCHATVSPESTAQVELYGTSQSGEISSVFIDSHRVPLYKDGEEFHVVLPNAPARSTAVVKLVGKVSEAARDKFSISLRGVALKPLPVTPKQQQQNEVANSFATTNASQVTSKLVYPEPIEGKYHVQLGPDHKANLSLLVSNEGPSLARSLALVIRPTRGYEILYDAKSLNDVESGATRKIDLQVVKRQAEEASPVAETEVEKPNRQKQEQELQIGIRGEKGVTSPSPIILVLSPPAPAKAPVAKDSDESQPSENDAD